jgi:hypothetical protein
MSDGSSMLLMGLKGSGKTSFLAALWHLVESNELPTGLTAPKLQPDRQYLNRIRDSWLRFEEVGRTSLRSQEVVSLLLNDSQTEGTVSITVPDLSGEVFRLQWATRRANRQYVEFASGSSGLLLLIHPANVDAGTRIPLSKEDVAIAASSESSNSNFSERVPGATRDWSANFSPTQVQLVDLLQMLFEIRVSAAPLRIAVMISAWDLIKEPILPSSWLERRLPLLFQYLVANSETLEFRTYGISALGGDLHTDRRRLQDEPLPSRRIKVVENQFDPHGDLTAPIRFLLGLSDLRPKVSGG